MGQYQRLLLIVEPDLHPSAAMRRACALARVSGAALHLCAFVQPQARTHLWGEKPMRRMSNAMCTAIGAGWWRRLRCSRRKAWM